MMDPHEFFETLVYRSVGRRRFTQMSPVMPDVWIRYGMQPGQQLELLLVPNWHYTPADLAQAIRDQLKADAEEEAADKPLAAIRRRYRDTRPPRGASKMEVARLHRPPSVAHNQNSVVATLWFDQLLRCVLPLSPWWRRSIAVVPHDRRVDSANERDVKSHDLTALLANRAQFTRTVAEVLADGSTRIPQDVVWLIRVASLIAYVSSKRPRDALKKAVNKTQPLVDATTKATRSARASALENVLRGVGSVDLDDDYPLFSVNHNRQTSAALYDSASAVKADAVHRVFNVEGANVRWAVVDSGIDARHVAFRRRDSAGTHEPTPFAPQAESRRRRRGASQEPRWTNQTRIVASYEFTHIRELLGADPDDIDSLDTAKFPALKDGKKRTALKEYLRERQEFGLDWQRLEPFLQIPHAESDDPQQGYRPPTHPHGTHVAGILAADWRDGDEPGPPGGPRMTGICPQIELYDLRVLDDEGVGNEFAIMSALQFVRDLNSRRDFMVIHGANLSFSIDHDVANYACGRTPVCEEATRLVNSGLVVAAAAGNSGRARYLTPSNLVDDGFRTVSITDPGNADAVITVGATHRTDPHTYGVSYFSSRGPTGDGRLKPDLVAPGEKIRSTVPGDQDETLDGTSMATPHVSGAAALLMSRHPEFIGEPQRIKKILCETATDLGRERYFQGAGLLDILRALQSV